MDRPPARDAVQADHAHVLSVFPEATLWSDGGLMVGSLKPLRIRPSTLAFKRANPQTRAALDEIGLRDIETLVSWSIAGPDEMKRFAGDGPVLTDDRPLVEYHRSLPANDPAVDLSTLRGDPSRLVTP